MAARALFSAPPALYAIPPLSSLASRAHRILLSSHFHVGPLSFSSTRRRCHHRACTDGSKGSTNSDSFVLTTPLYYVNAPPHMGSVYTTIAADAIARFQLQIEYNEFIRTTDLKHETVVNEFYLRVLDSGDIYRADYEGLYCVNCEEYKDEKELTENKCCAVHPKPCLLRKEDNYFFALSKYQSKLEELLTNNPEFVKPSFRLNEVQGWIKSGLRDFSISRASVEWGIPVPNDTKQTIYVWFDALLG